MKDCLGKVVRFIRYVESVITFLLSRVITSKTNLVVDQFLNYNVLGYI